MQVAGQIKERDYVSSQFVHLRPRLAFSIFAAILIIAMVWAAFARSSLASIGVLAYLLAFFAYIPWRARKIYRQEKAFAEPISVAIGDDGLFATRTNAQGLIPWDHIHKWRHNKTLVLLYPTSASFIVIPSHFFSGPEAFAEFIAVLKQKLGNAT